VRAIVLQHIACEPPGAIEDVLTERGAVIERVELDEGEPLPDWRGADLIVVMGGPMGAYDSADHPWLAPETRFIGEAVEAGTPLLGVCLGAQLLAQATGGRAYSGERPEIGLLPVEVTVAGRADPVFGVLPGTFTTLQWHGDTFDLPPGAVRLASSPMYPNQAFRVGNAYGVQFHLEVTEAMAREWAAVPAYARAADGVLGPGSLPGLLASFDTHRAGMIRDARTLAKAFLRTVGR